MNLQTGCHAHLAASGSRKLLRFSHIGASARAGCDTRALSNRERLGTTWHTVIVLFPSEELVAPYEVNGPGTAS